MRTKAAFGTLALIAVLGLAGCTGGPVAAPSGSASQGSTGSSDDAAGDEGQSTGDACALIADSITEATSQFQDASVDDPGAVAEAARSAAESLASTASEVTNDEVAALLPELQEMFGQTAEVMDAVAGGDVSQIEDAAAIGESFQVTVQKFQDICAG
jgi:hypothetical protein